MTEEYLGYPVKYEKGWIHSNGLFVPVTNPKEHHLHAIFQNPKVFGMDSDKLQKMHPEGLIRNWSDPIMQEVSEKGWIRFTNLSKRLPSLSSISPDSISHSYFLTHHGRSTKDEVQSHIDPILHQIYNFAKTKNIPDASLFVSVEGNLSRSYPSRIANTKQFYSIGQLGEYLGVGREGVRDVPSAPTIPTSSDIRAAMGQKPPEMTQAQWNMIRNIGDSYTPIMSFKKFLNEQLFLHKS